MKNYVIGLVVLAAVAGGAYLAYKSMTAGPVQLEPLSGSNNSATTTATQGAGDERQEQVGTSTQGRAIMAYHFGQGDTEILFVGGMHGGYSWTTALVAYELMDHLEANPQAVPAQARVTVIPALNPDGLFKVTGMDGRFAAEDISASPAELAAARFNANGVDLNRNFDCEWKASAVWQNKTVSGGTEPFSEPESRAIREYIERRTPDAVVVWYSAAGGVFASNCRNGTLAETTTLTKLYADASGYKPYQSFDFYAITGDMVNWLAKKNIPAISVLLSEHGKVEWDKNRAGIEAVLGHYAQ